MSNILVCLLLLITFTALSHSLPLSTSSRWIVDDATGERVKLACVNLPGHLEAMLPEGLDKRPVKELALQIAAMGFNCVRLTWATHMYTRYDNLTVAESFRNLGLNEAIMGLTNYNPTFLDLTLVDAQKLVINELANQGIMTVLDCQVSKPQWCCSDTDGNGFFGDEYFDPNEWLRGLSTVANRYKDQPMVVAMSLRNELRGPLQNVTVWSQYMPRGAQTIHSANPNVLVLVSGLSYDQDFTFLKVKPMNFKVDGKIVYEAHRYASSRGVQQCDSLTQDLLNRNGFLADNYPLFYTEFGINVANTSLGESMFVGCFMSYLAERDLDWSIWALQGDYYLRDGLHNPSETFGMLNQDWTSLQNPTFVQRLQLIQQKVQDPTSKGPSYYILHQAGISKCIKANGSDVLAGDCLSFDRWNYSGDGTPIKLLGTDLCISAVGEGLTVKLTNDCTSEQSQWEFVDSTKLEMKNKQGLCLDLDLDYSSKVTTKKCLCESDGTRTTCEEKQQTQWFKLITANVQ